MERGFKYHLLAELIRELEAAGQRLGTGQYLRVQDLMAKLPDDMPATELMRTLSPIFARSPAEQQQFYQLFKQSLKHTQAYFDSLAEAPTAPPALTDHQKRRKPLRWLMAALAFALLVPPLIVIGYLYWEDSARPLERPFTVQGGQKSVACVPDSIIAARIGSVSDFEVLYPGEGRMGTFLADPPGCLTYIAQDSLTGRDSIVIKLIGPDGQMQVNFKPLIEQASKTPEEDKPVAPKPRPPTEVQDTLPELAGWRAKSPPYQHDLLAFSTKSPSWLMQQLARYEGLLRAGGYLLAFALLSVLLLYRFSRRQTPKLSKNNDNPPYAWHIKMPEVEHIELGHNFQNLLNRLRRRTGSDVYQLDVPATIGATIRKGGMTEFQYRQQTQPPEYLLLIDQQSMRNHRARLFDYVFRVFRANEVLAVRFFYDGDMRRCYNGRYPDGLSLADLQQRYGQARLFVVGNGDALIHKMTGKLVGWSSLLQGWKERALFTPAPHGKWGKRERRLSQAFSVLPLCLESLEVLLEAAENDESPVQESWTARLAPHLKPELRFDGPLMASLQQQFPPALVKWVAACAVYPSLHWHLTLYLGRFLSPPDETLVSMDHIMELCRLPWFVEGEIPDNARFELVTWLETEHPQLLERIRLELVEVLDEHAPPSDSSAYEDYRLNAAMNEYLVVGQSARRDALAGEIAHLMGAGSVPDLVIEHKLKQQTSRLSEILPKRWHKRLYWEGMPALGLKHVWRELFWYVPALLIFAVLANIPWQLSISDCEGALVSLKKDEAEQFLCLNSQEAWYDFLEETVYQGISSDDLDGSLALVSRRLAVAQGQSWMNLSKEERVGQSRWLWYTPAPGQMLDANWGRLEADEETLTLRLNAVQGVNPQLAEMRANLSVLLYNQGAKLAEQSEAFEDDTELRDRACALFAAALALDTVFLNVQLLSDWCEGRSGFEPACKVVLQNAVLRARPSDASKAAAITAQYKREGADSELDRDWYLASLEAGTKVQLLEETAYNYWVSAAGLLGYLPKIPDGEALLADCEDYFDYAEGWVGDGSINAYARTGLSGVAVALERYSSSDTQSIATANTNGQGRYELEVPKSYPAQALSLRFSRQGYETIRLSIDWPTLRLRDQFLLPLEEGADTSFTLAAEVQDLATGKPLAEAKVGLEVTAQSDSASAIQPLGESDENGRVRLTVPATALAGQARLSLSISRLGYETSRYPVSREDLAGAVEQVFVLRPQADLANPKDDGKEGGDFVWCLDRLADRSTTRSPVFDDGKTQLSEEELSRDLLQRIKARLNKAGITYFEVVADGETLTAAQRAERINRYTSRKPKLVVSIGFDSFSGSKGSPWSDEDQSGVSARPQQNSDQASRLAAIFMERIMRQTKLRSRSILFTPNRAPDLPVSATAVIIRNGVLNNRQDAALLAQSAFRQKLADAYVDAILAIEKQGLNRTPAPFIEQEDSDGDGVPNRTDRCPFEPGKGSSDGCPQEEGPQRTFEALLQQAPDQWASNASALQNLSYKQIATYIPETGVRGRYAVLKPTIDISILERLIGEPVYVSGPHRSNVDFFSENSFGYYNPAFLRKLKAYLQAASQSPALVKSLQPLYDREFQQLMRAFFETYQVGTGDLKLQMEFRQILQPSNRTQTKQQVQQPQQSMSELFYPYYAQLGNDMEKMTAFRFWVRRSVDGTAGEFYDMLLLTLQTFDGGYLQRGSKQ